MALELRLNAERLHYKLPLDNQTNSGRVLGSSTTAATVDKGVAKDVLNFNA